MVYVFVPTGTEGTDAALVESSNIPFGRVSGRSDFSVGKVLFV